MEEPNRRSRPWARVICRRGRGPRSQGPAEQEAGRDQGLSRETGLGAELRTQAEWQGQAGEQGGVRSCHVHPTEAGKQELDIRRRVTQERPVMSQGQNWPRKGDILPPRGEA